MSQSVTFTESLSAPASWQVAPIYSGSSEAFIPATVPASTTNQLVPASVPISPAPVFWVMLSQGADLTVKTNSSGSPANTFTLKNGIPFVWIGAAAGYYTNPITTAITALYLTNASGSDTTFTMLAIFA